tara:strand:+ start:39885 stop:40235 length:351 start_codon:yes stop_codon:yes gene_type:complete
MRFFVVGLIAIFITSPALSDDNIKISCIEMAKLDGGGNMCDVSSEFSLKKSEYEALLRSYKKKECLKEYRRKYGHCPQINLWTTDIPAECEGHSPSNCETSKPAKVQYRKPTINPW